MRRQHCKHEHFPKKTRIKNSLDDAKNEPVLASHREVRALRVALHWSFGAGKLKQCVHRMRRANLVARRIHGEGESDWREVTGSVRRVDTCRYLLQKDLQMMATKTAVWM